MFALPPLPRRFAQPAAPPPQPLARLSTGSTVSPPNGVQTPPLAPAAGAAPAPTSAAAPHPVATLAQRLGLRRAHPAPPKQQPAAAAEPRPSLEEPPAAASLAMAALPMPAPVSTEPAAGAAEAGAAAAATPTATPAAAGKSGAVAVVPGSPESDDWEQDCGVPAEGAAAPAAAVESAFASLA